MRRVIRTKVHSSGVESLRGKETKIDELVFNAVLKNS